MDRPPLGGLAFPGADRKSCHAVQDCQSTRRGLLDRPVNPSTDHWSPPFLSAARFFVLSSLKNNEAMPRKKTIILTQPVPDGKTIKVRLDGRTIVHLKSMKTFEFWRKRYPKAEVIG